MSKSKLDKKKSWGTLPKKKPKPGLDKKPTLEQINVLLDTYEKKEYDIARMLAADIVKNYPNHQFTWKVLSAALQQLGRLKEAIFASKKAVELSTDDAEACSNLGILYQELGMVKEAEISYLNAITINPNYPKVHNNLGSVLYTSGRFEEAVLSYKEAIKLDPNYSEAYGNLGIALQQLDKLDEAEVSYKKAIALNPNYPEAHNNLGIALRKLGKLESSISAYRKAIELSPNYPQAYNNLGVGLQELRKLDESESAYRKAIELSPNYPEAYSNLGNTLQEAGRLKEAEVSYKKALELNPSYPEALFNYSLGEFFSTNFERAAQSLEKVLSMNSTHYRLRASVNLAILKFLNGDFLLCKELLLSSSEIIKKSPTIFKNEIAYWEYLSRLLKWHELNPGLNFSDMEYKNLYVIGDSHALAYPSIPIFIKDQPYYCKPILIYGCKQWHLGNSSPNKYKYCFESALNNIPASSEILLSIGEIDCRLNEGILFHIRKYPNKDKNTIIKSTIDGYLKYISRVMNPYKHSITVQAVPCPNISLENVAQKEVMVLIELIKIFNSHLKQQAVNLGFKFLDLHQMTDRGDGLSNKSWHIDTHHLNPAGMAEALRKHLV